MRLSSRLPGTIVLLGMLVGATTASLAADQAILMRIGDTGILCVREPCPRRGIIEVHEDGRSHPSVPLWSGTQLPALSGSAAHRHLIEQAWKTPQGSILAYGYFEGGRLVIVGLADGQGE